MGYFLKLKNSIKDLLNYKERAKIKKQITFFDEVERMLPESFCEDRNNSEIAEIINAADKKIYKLVRAINFRNDLIRPSAASYVLDNCPKSTLLMYDHGCLHHLCVDAQSFRKVTFMLGSLNLINYQTQCFMGGMMACPEEALKHVEFYSKQWNVNHLIMLMLGVPLPPDFRPIMELIEKMDSAVQQYFQTGRRIADDLNLLQSNQDRLRYQELKCVPEQNKELIIKFKSSLSSYQLSVSRKE